MKPLRTGRARPTYKKPSYLSNWWLIDEVDAQLRRAGSAGLSPAALLAGLTLRAEPYSIYQAVHVLRRRGATIRTEFECARAVRYVMEVPPHPLRDPIVGTWGLV